MSISDHTDLIAAAIAGDHAATGRLFYSAQPALLAYVTRHLPRELAPHIETRDIVQDTFIEGLRRFGTFVDEEDDGFYRWLVTIARRQMLQLLRAQRTLKRGGGLARNGLATKLLSEIAVSLNTPSRAASNHELAIAMEACVAQLPAEQQQALRLRYIDQLPIPQIAQRMNRTDGSVSMLCHRALKRLGTLLQSMSRFR